MFPVEKMEPNLQRLPTVFLLILTTCQTQENHNYNWRPFRLPLALVRNEFMRRRHEDLIEFAKDAGAHFEQKDTISPLDIIGVIPNKIFVQNSKNESQSVAVEDSESADQNLQPVQTFPDEDWLDPQFDDFHVIPKYDQVKVRVFREPKQRYTIVTDHVEHKYFAPWGYFISQPAEEEPDDWKFDEF